MKLSPIIGVFVCGAVLCSAQNGAPPPSAPAHDAKLAPAETIQPAPPPVAAGTEDNALPPTAKSATEPKADQDNPGISKYLIGPLDVLYVRVWNQPNLSGILDVGPDGTVSMPLIGEIKADGLTAVQLKTAITARLNDFLNNPEVSVSVTKINSKSVLLIGGVAHPGKFPLNEKTTVLDALAGSGGFRDFANQKKIYILRGTKKIMFNYKEVIQGKHPEQNIELENGDRIVVPE